MTKKFNKILLIDDDKNLNKVIAYQLTQMDFNVSTAITGNSGLDIFKQNEFDIVITDIQLPDIDGLSVLTSIRRLNKAVIIIIITAFGTIENAIEAGRLGADEYLTKPFGKETLRFVIEKAIHHKELHEENIQLRSELFQKYDFQNIIGKSAAMEDVLKLTGRVAESDATILIQGESGTGKELIARAIHYNSPRKNESFITVNCPSIPENLIESELFGHIKGSFTGASKDRKGKFLMADQGTIFLDEIGDLKEDLQAKLLRVLQEKEIERVGESETIKIDVRVVAATNKDLYSLVQEGIFREDLYYRLNVVTIQIPPLRDHKEDITYLIDHFLQKHGKGKNYKISKEVSSILNSYYWPGNIRELGNCIERAIILSPVSTIATDVLPPLIKENLFKEKKPELHITDTNLTLDEIERNAIINALNKTNNNQTKAAKLLNIHRHVLIYRMKKLGVT